MRRRAFRPGPWLGLALCLLAPQGCTFLYRSCVFTYDRVRDTLDMVDLGLTVSWKPSVSAYACLFGLGGLGAGGVDGYFAGVGGGRAGVFRHYHSNIGLLIYSYEVLGWGDFDVRNRDTLTRRHRGPIGWLFFPSSGGCSGPT